MGRLFALLFLADLALVVVALIDCLSCDARDVRALPRFAWIFLILLFSPVGPIVWFLAGRPQQVGVGGGVGTASRFPERQRQRRQLAPDDDPDFLKGIATSSREDEELLRRWEEDLRRREDDPRTKKPEDPTE
jgi:Phospholipase_D-nuclease N-terminal